MKHHPGTPMALSPEDGPFDKARLIEIARYYHPAMAYGDSAASSSDEISRIEESTPEWKARLAVHTQAMANREPFQELVRTLDATLPDYLVTDRTPRHWLDPAYVVEILPRDESRDGRLLGMVSVIAPVYFIGQVVDERTMRNPIDPEFASAVQVLEREIAARFPYQRLDHETGNTIVPELRTGNQGYGETTLIDLLMYSHW